MLPTQIRFGLAAQAFADVCRRIELDEENPFDPQVQAVFRELAENLKNNADDCYLFKLSIEEAIERCDNIARGIAKKKKSFKSVLDQFKATVLEHVGEKVKGSIVTIFKTRRKSLSDTLEKDYTDHVTIEEIRKHKIDARFIRQKISYKLDRDEVERYLAVPGQTLPWARIIEKDSLTMKGVAKDGDSSLRAASTVEAL